jgi:hypothetical protein
MTSPLSSRGKSADQGVRTNPQAEVYAAPFDQNVNTVKKNGRIARVTAADIILSPSQHTPDASGCGDADGNIVITVNCACGLTIEAPFSLAEKSVKCPKCSAAVTIPYPESSPQDLFQEDGSIPSDLKDNALAELDRREKVVWLGQPVAGLVFLRNSGWLLFAGIGLVIAFITALQPASVPPQKKDQAVQAAGKVATPAKRGTGVELALLVLFVAWVGTGLIPAFRWYYAKRTCYVLTNRRALVYKEYLLGRPTRQSYPPTAVAQMRQSNSWIMGGRGDLIFRTVAVIRNSGGSKRRWASSVQTINYGFLAVANVQEVGKLVRETLINPFVSKLKQANSF